MKPLNRLQHPLFSSHYAINTTNTEGMSPLANLQSVVQQQATHTGGGNANKSPL